MNSFAPDDTGNPAPILLGGAELTSLYESFNEGATVTNVFAPSGATGTPTAYTYASAGGFAYFGTSTGELFERNAYGEQFTQMFSPSWGPMWVRRTIREHTPSRSSRIPIRRKWFMYSTTTSRSGAAAIKDWSGKTSRQGTNLPSLTQNLNPGDNGNGPSTVESLQVFDPTPYSFADNVLLAGALGGVYQLNVNLRTRLRHPLRPGASMGWVFPMCK